MNVRELDALRAFVETGSVAKAADRLLRTAPQISRTLAALEEEVGFEILSRNGRNLVLTERGMEFYKHAEQVLSACDSLERHAKTLRRGEKRSIRIIAAPIVSHALINKALARFLTRHPQVEIQLEARIRLDLETWVSKEAFDVGIVFLPLRSDSFDIHPLLDVKAVVAVHPDHCLAANDVITFDELVEHDIVTMDKRSVLRSHLDSLSVQSGRELKVRVEVPNGVVACQLASANIGLCLSDPFVARSSGMNDIVLRRFEPSIPIRYGLIYPRWIRRNQIVDELVDEIVQFAKEQLEEDWIIPALR